MCTLKVSLAHIAHTFLFLSPKLLGGLSGPLFHSPIIMGKNMKKKKKARMWN